MKSLFYIILFQFILADASAQDFNYVHYDTKDGLAGSTVYDMCQDKDGFMWFATENGLSRFDGTTFKNFTVKDGLPDNEVLKVFADSRGRVWIGTFSKEICFYYRGRIYNKENCHFLRQTHTKAMGITFAEDTYGTVAIGSISSVTMISSKDSVKEFTPSEIFGKNGSIGVSSFSGKILVAFEREIYYLYEADNSFSLFSQPSTWGVTFNPNDKNYLHPVKIDSTGKVVEKYLKLKGDMISWEGEGLNSTYVNSSDGTWAIDTASNQWSEHFLPGKKISRTFKDYEGHLWFSTFGEGIFKLPSKEIRTIDYKDNTKKNNSEIFSIIRDGDIIVGGISFSKGIKVFNKKNVGIIDYSSKMLLSKNTAINNRLYTIKKLSSGVVLLGFDAFLVKQDPVTPSFNYIYPIKSIEEIDPATTLVGTGSYVFKIRVKDLAITDTIWRGRSTRVFYNQHKYYIGTINGLYQLEENKTRKYLGDISPLLTRRITDIKCTADNTLWIATGDEGIVAYKDGRIIKVIKETNGLSSNICKSLFLHGNFLWVGTNKGLNKIDLGRNNYPVVRFSSSDGLPSDIINAVYAEDSLVWVGSPAGLTYFDESKLSNKSICNFQLLGVNIDDKEQKIDSSYQLSYKNNSISFEYVAISFKSGGDIVYHYKLKGLDNDWKQTRQTNLNYQSLSGGDYELEIYGLNKFGVKSKTIKIKFTVTPPFWKTWWFYTLIFSAVILITWWMVSNRSIKKRINLEEKIRVQQQFAGLEQQALQAQMNPHFIFNCLNSIQQYILTNDKEKANLYLTGFASLVRQTLDNSGKKTITVAEEVRYLTTYIEMEKMRFGDNFIYTITVDGSINADFVEIPAMLFQPYVENCLRHGIRYREAGFGKVDISFSKVNEILCCSIKDNGIGREKAKELKSQQHIEYQSKGMSLTEKRIALLNAISREKIEIKVIDLKDALGNADGTEIIINIPI